MDVPNNLSLVTLPSTDNKNTTKYIAERRLPLFSGNDQKSFIKVGFTGKKHFRSTCDLIDFKNSRIEKREKRGNLRQSHKIALFYF